MRANRCFGFPHILLLLLLFFFADPDPGKILNVDSDLDPDHRKNVKDLSEIYIDSKQPLHPVLSVLPAYLL
jgi:hypothetical protein